MSTRSRSRQHPYQRTRRSSRTNGRRRELGMSGSQGDVNPNDPGSCIDLTANDTLDGDVIDLTESTLSPTVIDADPIVVISPSDVDNAEMPQARRRIYVGSSWDASDEEDDVERQSTSSGSGGRPARTARNNSAINLDDLSDEDLPEVPFRLPEASLTSSASTSPPAKVTCPVCLDTDAQIRRNRELYSTICGHIFCSACIKQAIDTQHACPTCRKKLTKRQIHKIFL